MANIDLLLSRALQLHQTGKLSEARAVYEQILKKSPTHSKALNLLGATYLQQREYQKGLPFIEKALLFKPDFLEAYNNLGTALKGLGQYEEAIVCYQKALALKPDYALAYYNLGLVLKQLNRPNEAIPPLQQAVKLKPDHADAFNHLGIVLREAQRHQEAIHCFQKAVSLKPDFADAYNNLGIVLSELHQLEEAITCFQKTLALKPDSAEAYRNLAIVFKDAGQMRDAISCYRHAVKCDPQNIQTHSDLVYGLCFLPECDERSILAEAQNFSLAHPATRISLRNSRAAPLDLPEKRLRIGYVSPDFKNHCQSLFTVPLLSNHNHEQFEIYCYADRARDDAITERLKTYADVWRPTHQTNDAQLAEIIAGDGIDILVDLTMHMANGRPMVFTRKPAPVQVAWLAYPGTTGIPEIDYRFTDPWLDPSELGDVRYTEKSIRLPDTFWCYDPLIADLLPNNLPALTSGYITFGCLNNFCKVSDDTLRRWGQIMAKVESSHLILLAPAKMHRQRVSSLLGKYGIAAERIEFADYRPRDEYLKTYHQIDICLDTLPYNGHTTSLDAFWMGVPVVTQVGHTIVGRAGWSQLNNLGLNDLAAFDDQTFIDVAVALATDLPRLNLLRQNLRSRMRGSPLMNGKHFAKAIETAYRHIWNKNCEVDNRQIHASE